MNPISKALADLKFRIPTEILIEVFAPKSYRWIDSTIGYEEQIKNLVIRQKVLVDCDLVGGNEVTISLAGVPMQYLDTGRLSSVYRIPKDRTQGRSITSVLSIAYISGNEGPLLGAGMAFNNCSVTDTLMAGKAVMDAASTVPLVSTAKVQLIGENTVLVTDSSYMPGVGLLRCLLANDENLSHLQLRSYPKFSKLVELAVKSYIYNNYSIALDTGKIVGGYEIGKFREIVDSYADAEQMYEDYLKEVWQKVLFMNDRTSFERDIRMRIGSFR